MTHQHLGPRPGDCPFDHDHADGELDHTHGHGETWRVVKPRPRPRVYIAGYISADPVGGVRDAIAAFFELWDAGYNPFCPHLDLLLQLQRPLSWDEWLEYDFRWIEVCDAVYLIPEQAHPSPGADRECAYAEERGIPVARAGLEALKVLCPPADTSERARDGRGGAATGGGVGEGRPVAGHTKAPAPRVAEPGPRACELY